jgi:DNA processing protein
LKKNSEDFENRKYFVKFNELTTFTLNHSNLLYQIALTNLHGIGPKRASILVSTLEKLESVFTEQFKDIQHQTGFRHSLLINMKRDEALRKAEEHLNYILKHAIQTHFYLDSNYPRRLKQCVDAPLLLYSKGNFDPNPTRAVAIVGTRSSTNYGATLCEQLISTFAGKNIQVVSGMAYGIDVQAHQHSVKNDIETIGVLGHGLDRIYPGIHRRIAENMFHRGGLLTEFPFGTKPDKENFPMRNRIVAGLTDATIVIESSKKGGSLITARLANDYNRDVFAFPGNIGSTYSEGCNMLIKQQQAHLVLSGDDFLSQMNWTEEAKPMAIQRSCFIELSETERSICLNLEGKSGEYIDVIANQTSLPISALNVHLFHLEMKGMIQTLPGKKYRLV